MKYGGAGPETAVLLAVFQIVFVNSATGHEKQIEYKHRGNDKDRNSVLVETVFCKLKVDWTLHAWMVLGWSCSTDGHDRSSQKCKG